MRKTQGKKGALTVKQSAILFVCAILCVCMLWKAADILKNDLRSPSENLVIPEVTQEATTEPTETPAPTVPPTPTPEPTPTPTPAPTPQPTEEPLVVVPANPMHELEKQESYAGEPIGLPLSGLVIGIDPGHQEKGNSEREPVAPGSYETKAKVSSGTYGRFSGVPEYVTNLEVSLMLKEELERLGAEVHMTRTTHDVDISNIERAQMFNELDADLVLRIHCNGSTNENAEGIGLYVTQTGSIAEESYAIAKVVLDAMIEETGASSDGVFRRDTYSGLNWSEVPSMIVEMGFMTNEKEDWKLQDEEYRMKLVRGMINGIAQYYERDIDFE